MVTFKEMTPQIERHINANMNLSKKKIMLVNFLGGISWGVGSALGATIIVALLLWILSLLNFIPGLGEITSGIIESVKPSK